MTFTRQTQLRRKELSIAIATVLGCLWFSLLFLEVRHLSLLGGILFFALAMLNIGLILTLFHPAREWSRSTEGDESRPVPRMDDHDAALAVSTPVSIDAMTRSALVAIPPTAGVADDLSTSGDFSITDMVNRLEPRQYRWLDSSLAEQEFLGCTIGELQSRSFLDLVHPDDRQRAKDAFSQAAQRGECLGLVLRLRTTLGRTRAVEMNIGARYAADHSVSYLRSHLTDVTEKVRAEKQLRVRTQELIRVNEQLREINRELVDLKDRYSDLYSNAPAMYFSLDPSGRLVECNEVFLRTLERTRGEMIGKTFELFVDPAHIESCRAKFARLLEAGSLDAESKWVKSSGEHLDVWVSGSVLSHPRSQHRHARCVAQDVTSKHRLEAELRSMNQSLSHANAELLRKNHELDEFVYVVSHDLQEPIRTMMAFSEFLLQDHAANLGTEGRDYIRHVADASQRMRAMIQGLLNLSRAGKVTEEFAPVWLEELVNVARGDLGELIRGRGAELVYVGPSLTLWGDRRRLQQLLNNLVSNGIKYNESKHPRVVVGVGDPVEPESDAPSVPFEQEDDTIDSLMTADGPIQTFYIRDNGIGIDPRHHQRIFQLFRRLHTANEYEGTGVGLALCNKIVQAHGGLIRVNSGTGAGSTFVISLPARPDSDAIDSELFSIA